MKFPTDNDQNDRPAKMDGTEFPEGGWGAFAGRLVGILSFLAIMVMGFLAMTGLWRLF
ncbi:MAG: hypothetical protein WA989_09575 [Henriciella sp.]|uniref:hypothetical protein n=1 Tax=Henriciella sp. TaxID=1968823 RepID=UPI003C71603C